MIGKHKLKLDTPCLIIDKEKLLSNIKLMQNFATDNNKDVRPHAKTHKCPKICELQLQEGSVGISITKPSEALELVNCGIKNILITSPIVTSNKLRVFAKILNVSPETIVVVDSFENLHQLNKLGMELSLKIKVLIDVDAGIGRTGLNFNDAFDLAITASKNEHIELKGIQCYAGHYQHIIDINERRIATETLLVRAGKLKSNLEKETGVDKLIQSGSGTGTYEIDCTIDAVTEIQPGSYTVMDKEYCDIDKDINFKPAMTLLTTVISANHDTHVTVDAGTKAIYKETTYPEILNYNRLKYHWDGFGDEHGKITGDTLPIVGDVLEIIVPHCDPTINLHDVFYVTENDIVVEMWDISLRGKVQ